MDLTFNEIKRDYTLVLATLNEIQIGELAFKTAFSYSPALTSTGEISFSLPYEINDEVGNIVRTPHYDELDSDMLVLVDGKDWFYLDSCVETDESGIFLKNVHGFHREYELTTKSFNDYAPETERLLYFKMPVQDGVDPYNAPVEVAKRIIAQSDSGDFCITKTGKVVAVRMIGNNVHLGYCASEEIFKSGDTQVTFDPTALRTLNGYSQHNLSITKLSDDKLVLIIAESDNATLKRTHYYLSENGEGTDFTWKSYLEYMNLTKTVQAGVDVPVTTVTSATGVSRAIEFNGKIVVSNTRNYIQSPTELLMGYSVSTSIDNGETWRREYQYNATNYHPNKGLDNGIVIDNAYVKMLIFPVFASGAMRLVVSYDAATFFTTESISDQAIDTSIFFHQDAFNIFILDNGVLKYRKTSEIRSLADFKDFSKFQKYHTTKTWFVNSTDWCFMVTSGENFYIFGEKDGIAIDNYIYKREHKGLGYPWEHAIPTDNRLNVFLTDDKDPDGYYYGIINQLEELTTWRFKRKQDGTPDIPDEVRYQGRLISTTESNILDTLNIIQQAWNCFFKYNTMDKIISIHTFDELTQDAFAPNGLLTDDNFIISISREIKHQDIKTRLFMYNKDGVGALGGRLAHGQPYLEDYTFFMNNKYMSPHLITALLKYQSKLQDHEVELSQLWAQRNLLNIENSLNEKKIEDLLESQIYFQQEIDLYDRIKEGYIANPGTSEERVIIPPRALSYEERQAQNEAKLHFAELSYQIRARKSVLQTSYPRSRDQIKNDLDLVMKKIKDLSTTTNMNYVFAEYESDYLLPKDSLRYEMEPYIRDSSFKSDTIGSEDTEALLDLGIKLLKRVSRPHIQFSINLLDFLSLVEFSDAWSLMELGQCLRIENSKLGFIDDVFLLKYTHEPDSQTLTMEFSNNLKLIDDTTYLAEMIAKSSTASSAVAFNSNYWSKGGDSQKAQKMAFDEIYIESLRTREYVTGLLTNAMGGYVKTINGEMFIADTDNIENAQKIWRWNLNGLGYSRNGLDGPYETAITMDGKIVADFITTGQLDAGLLRTGLLSSAGGETWIDLTTGFFQLGGLKYDKEGFRIFYGEGSSVPPQVQVELDRLEDPNNMLLALSETENYEAQILAAITAKDSTALQTNVLTLLIKYHESISKVDAIVSPKVQPYITSFKNAFEDLSNYYNEAVLDSIITTEEWDGLKVRIEAYSLANNELEKSINTEINFAIHKAELKIKELTNLVDPDNLMKSLSETEGYKNDIIDAVNDRDLYLLKQAIDPFTANFLILKQKAAKIINNDLTDEIVALDDAYSLLITEYNIIKDARTVTAADWDNIKGLTENYYQVSEALELAIQTAIQDAINTNGQSLENFTQAFKFSSDGFSVIGGGSELKLQGGVVQFYNGETPGDRWENGRFYTNQIEVLTSAIIGNHKIEKMSNGITIGRSIGGI